MDDLLREFLTETNESLDTVDVELVRFEQEPNNTEILGNIFVWSTPSKAPAASSVYRACRSWRTPPKP
jgi:chemotaxis protein histidine kinase CheA